MSSGQWEVVGRKKDKTNKNTVKVDKKDKKKNDVINPKVEEILPQPPVKNSFTIEKPKENKKPQEKTKNQNNNAKKPQKKPEKPQEPPKPKPPKSIESALISIDVEEFKSIFERSKQHFSLAPIVWLKELSQYLNLKVAVDLQDPVFMSRPTEYPWSVIPLPIKTIIEKSIKEAGKSNAQSFFDIALTSMATDMGKGLPGLGHKFYLQYIANSDPSVAVNSMNKYIVLRNSYQNRPNIGSSILWAVGQTGNKDLSIGLKVFQDLMLPLIEMKNYARFIASYLLQLLKQHKNIVLTKEQYLLVLDTVFSGKKNFPMDLKQEFIAFLPSLKASLFNMNGTDKYNNYIELFLKKLTAYSNKSYQDCLCDILVECFIKDNTSLGTWSLIYAKHLQASAILLNYIADNWNSISKKKFPVRALTALLNTFKVTNDQLSTKKRKDEGLHDVISALKKLNEKMTKKSKSGFPIKTFLFLLTLGLGTALYIDINQHGSWKDCRTNKALKDSGIHEYTHKALNRTKEGLLWVDDRVEKSFPGVHKTVADFSEPYVQLTKDLGLIGYNMCANIKKSVIEKYPVVLQTIDYYAPGLLDTTQKVAVNVWTGTSFYFHKSVDFLKKEVFVGQLAPENIGKTIVHFVSLTQQKVTDCYHWLYEKVQNSIK